jgi:hypothetical protein
MGEQMKELEHQPDVLSTPQGSLMLGLSRHVAAEEGDDTGTGNVNTGG